MMYNIGIDIGSTTSEIVVLDQQQNIVYLKKTSTNIDMNKTGNILLENALSDLKITHTQVPNVTVTGYGRKHLEIDDIEKLEKTEISCYGKGALHFNKNVRTIIDIGGQDSKVISIDENGKVVNFNMNDKCAAGTGKFIELICKQFNLELEKIGTYSEKSTASVKMTNICAVFAESEIISLLAEGRKIEDIIKSVEVAIAQRVYGMAERVGVVNEIMFCGGVAQNKGMHTALKEKFARDIFIPEHVEFVGAVGAALYGSKI